MRHSLLTLPLLAALAGCGGDEPASKERFIPEAPYTRYVDPFIGTGGLGFGYAAAFPGPQPPYGMIRPGPDTGTEQGAASLNHFSGYYYGDPLVHAFSLTRVQGTGIIDYGAPGLVFSRGFDESKTDTEGQRSRHAGEEAEPGYYKTSLLDPEIDVEITASVHTALFRLEATAAPTVILDIGYSLPDVDIYGGEVSLDVEARELFGHVHFGGGYSDRAGGLVVYFVIRADRDFAEAGLFDGAERLEAELTHAEGADVGAFFTLVEGEGAPVVAAAISFVDVEGARRNLEAEASDLDFDRVRGETRESWEEHLGKVRVEGASEREARIFYSSLYRTLLMPTRLSDVDGRYRGLDHEVHTAEGYNYLSDLSLWDTFRTLHPLLILLYPEHQRDVLHSLTAMAEDGGFVPRWPMGTNYTGGMVGDPAAMVLAESWLKGLRDFDLRVTYEALRATALERPPEGSRFDGRGAATEEYVTLGYVPVETAGAAASRTMEFAYADHAIAVMAEALGEADDAALFFERAGNYKNVYDEEHGFFIGRKRDGSFESFRGGPGAWQSYYTEGAAYQYLFYAPHDPEGLAELLGGASVALDRLDEIFELSTTDRLTPVLPARYYWHGNEPDLHYAFVFSDLGDHERSVRWSRWVLESQYGDGPDGLPGNDDGGTLSAWYVFASLGFYPIAGDDRYLLGAPIFERAELDLPGGTLVISNDDPTAERYRVTLDGEALEAPRFTHAQIEGGGVLRFSASR